jgi:hypothetical protein
VPLSVDTTVVIENRVSWISPWQWGKDTGKMRVGSPLFLESNLNHLMGCWKLGTRTRHRSTREHHMRPSRQGPLGTGLGLCVKSHMQRNRLRISDHQELNVV